MLCILSVKVDPTWRRKTYRAPDSSGIPIKTLAASGNSSSASNRSAYSILNAQTYLQVTQRSRSDSSSCRKTQTPIHITHLFLKRGHPRLHLFQTHLHDVLLHFRITDCLELNDILCESLSSDDLRISENGFEEEGEVGLEGNGWVGESGREETDEGLGLLGWKWKEKTGMSTRRGSTTSMTEDVELVKRTLSFDGRAAIVDRL